ncbi:MAG: ribose transport system permease protein [Solirubrobacteraceae bacterium]|jgi:ribose transport system permease protein|nr:ribose transport system permease protein [Solirubrobacteraceae bacterium]
MRWRPAEAKYAVPAIVGLVVLWIANAASDSAFLTAAEWGTLAAAAIPFVLAAMAQAPAILSGRGGIDLSVGPLMGLVNAIVMGGLVKHGTTSPVVIILVALGVGLLAGFINGALVAYVRIPPIIATLGTYFVFSSLTFIVMPLSGGIAPHWLSDLRGQWGPVPGVTAFFVVVVAIWLLVSSTSYVRNLLATGSDDRAAYTAGVGVTSVRLVAYTLGGVIAAVGGLALTVTLGSGDPGAGPPFTLYAIAGAALGGLSLGGGRGGILGAAAGGFIFFLTQNLLTAVNISVFALQIATGIVVLVAVGLNSVGSYIGRRQAASAA